MNGNTFEERLQASYVQENGSKLLLGSVSGFDRDEAIQSQIHMLQANEIAGVLPFQAEMIDGRYRFRYGLAGKRSFAAALRGMILTEDEVKRWLLQLTHTIRKAGDFLLDEEGFVIHPDWMWTAGGAGIHEVCLLYVPLRRAQGENPLWSQWNELYHCLLRNGVPHSSLESVNPQLWTPQSFTLRLLANALETLSQTRNVKAAPPIQHQLPPVERMDEVPPRLREDGETMRLAKPELLHRKVLLGVLCVITILGFLATWEWIWLCGAVLSAAGWVMTARGLINLFNGLAFRKSSLRPKEEISISQEKLPDIPEGTTWLPPRVNETVLLAPADYPGIPEAKADPWIEVCGPGEREEKLVQVTEEAFFIGRGPQGVHVLADHPGISRVHVEIRRDEDGGFTARDVGSKNGTFFNKEPMVAFRPYQLETGDTVRLPGMHFVFHKEQRT